MRILCLILLLLFSARNFSQPPAILKNTHQASVPEGYYFLSPLLPPAVSTDSSYAGWNLILDKHGNLLYYKKFGGSKKATDFKIWDQDKLSYFYDNHYCILDSTFRIIKKISAKNVQTDHHEIIYQPDGTTTLLATETFTMDLRPYRYFNKHLRSAGSATALIISGVIQEQDADGNVVWEWHAKDHFEFSEVDSSYLADPTKVDWTHFNSLFLDGDGNYILSIRHFNQVVKIRRSTGEIIWRLGGKKNGFKFIKDEKRFLGQHDVKITAQAELRLFDNGREGHPASFKIYHLNEKDRTAVLVRKYQPHSGNSEKGLGNSQVIGQHTLYNPGIHEFLSFSFEVRNKSNVSVLSLVFKDTLRSYRVYHYKNLPFRVKRPRIILAKKDNRLYLSCEETHKTYLWNTGENTKTIEVSRGKNYQVWVPAETGFISSEITTVH